MPAANRFSFLDHLPDATHHHFSWEEHNARFRESNVIIKARTGKIEYPEHWGGLSIKTVNEGVECYQINGRDYRLDRDLYLILNQDQWYSSRVEPNEWAESFTINFTRQFEQEIMHYNQNDPVQLLDHPCTDQTYSVTFTNTLHFKNETVRLIMNSLAFLTADIGQNSGRIEELYAALFAEVWKNEKGLQAGKEKLVFKKHSTKEEVFRRVTLAKDYIHCHYAEADLSLEQIAGVAFMNLFHLIRSFRQVYGLSPYQYLKQIRLEKAAQLLQGRQHSVSEVMQLCGYEDLPSFSKSFRARYGIAPSRYANNQF